MIFRKAILLVFINLLVVSSTQLVFSQYEHDHSNNVNRDKDRWMWQMPNRVINEIGITDGMVVADVGAGEGYFSIPLSKSVGKNGRVYASDIDLDALNVLKKKSIDNNLDNIVVIHGKTMDPSLPEKECDIILVVNTIHFIDDFKKFMDNSVDGLKPGGKVVIVQWDAGKMSKEEPHIFEEMFSMATVLRKIYSSGMDVQKILTFLPMQNIYICTVSN